MAALMHNCVKKMTSGLQPPFTASSMHTCKENGLQPPFITGPTHGYGKKGLPTSAYSWSDVRMQKIYCGPPVAVDNLEIGADENLSREMT